METPLNAREFLKRFHLPQLVRINHQILNSQEENEDSSIIRQQQLGELILQQSNNSILEDEISPNPSTGSRNNNNLSPGQSNTSISSSFVAIQANTHEASHWIYNSGLKTSGSPNCRTGSSRNHQQQQVASARSHQDLVLADSSGQTKSLLYTATTTTTNNNVGRNGSPPPLGLHRNPEDDDIQPFRSISAWSSVQVNRMLEQQQLTVRVPRASLMLPHQSKQQVLLDRPATKKSVEFCDRNGNGWLDNESTRLSTTKGNPTVTQPSTTTTTRNSNSNSNSNANSKSKCESASESIRLTPPSKRPQLSKLELNQPFLLYKAYKKLELCAYIIDPKNELNEKSGDPIYFPQNYPGK